MKRSTELYLESPSNLELENRAMRGQLSYLQQENDNLREQIARQNEILLGNNINWPELKLGPQCLALLQLLYRHAPKICTREACFVAMYASRPDCDWAEAKILDVQMCRVRKRLPSNSVETIWGRGFRLSLDAKSWLSTRAEEIIG